MKIKIEAELFVQFLKLINLEGLVFDCCIKADKKFLISKGLDVAKSIYFYVEQEAKIFQPGIMIIGNIALFIKVLERFSGLVAISSDDKYITIRKSNKFAKFAIAKKKDIDSFNGVKSIKVEGNAVTTPRFKIRFANNYILNGGELIEIVKDAAVLDEHVYSLESKDGLICRVIKDGNSFATRIKLSKKKIKSKIEQNFGHGIKEIFNTLTDKINLFLDSKSPAMLIRFGEGFKNLYLITGVERKA